MTTRPSHVCLFRLLRTEQYGVIFESSVCECGAIRYATRPAVPVTGKQLRLWISKERSE